MLCCAISCVCTKLVQVNLSSSPTIFVWFVSLCLGVSSRVGIDLSGRRDSQVCSHTRILENKLLIEFDIGNSYRFNFVLCFSSVSSPLSLLSPTPSSSSLLCLLPIFQCLILLPIIIKEHGMFGIYSNSTTHGDVNVCEPASSMAIRPLNQNIHVHLSVLDVYAFEW